MATFNGTEGNDTLIGGSAADDLHGFGGNDFLQGGDGADTVLGDGGNDTMSGNGGNDWVRGGTGNDQVSGGSGQDSFAFHEFGATNADVLVDFSGNWDNIQLDGSAFTALGSTGRFSPGDARFRLGTAAQDADDRIIYNQATGQLWYDADGSGAGAAQLIATLSNRSAMSATDIFVFDSGTPPPPPPGTINGTAGNDTIVGTTGNDTINGLGGNDSLVGWDGADSISGGDGDDTLDGFSGSAPMPGGPEAQRMVDTLAGGLGNDTFETGGEDVLVDAGGVDRVIAYDTDFTLGAGFENLRLQRADSDGGYNGIGNDLDNIIDSGGFEHGGTLDGRGGNDFLIAAQHDTVLIGGAGNDTLQGGQVGTDTLTGGTGNDLLIGYDGFSRDGADFDVLDGGAGNDTLDGTGWFVFSAAPGAANADSFVAFTSGLDTIQLDATVHANAGVTGRFASGDARFHAAPGANAGHDATDRVIYNTSTGQLWYDADGSGAGAAQLMATMPVGTSLAATDIEILNGAPPPTTITGTAGNDSLVGTAGEDTINGLGGNDTLRGLGANDSLDGGAGMDLLDGGAGADFMVGGADDDVYIVDDPNDFVVEFENGGEDLVQSSVSYFMPSWVNNLTLTGTAPLEGIGNELDNAITGNSVDNTLSGGDGLDTLSGGLGNDTYLYGNFDVIIETGGVDTQIEDAGIGSGNLQAGVENLILQGVSERPETIASGNDLNNRITVNVSSSTSVFIDGFAGDDTLIGGDATGDKFTFRPNGAADYGHDVVDGRGSFDWLMFGGNDSAVNVNFISGRVLGGGATASSDVTFTNIEGATGTVFGDTMIADAGGRRFLADAGDDTLVGGAGADELQGDGFFGAPLEPLGNDSISGGGGNDSVDGGRGNDVLDGGTGNDSLWGGNDADVFRFSAAPGAADADAISDFESALDTIQLDASVMTALGSSGRFAAGDARFHAAAGANGGHDADDRVVYNTSTGQLWYDADGSGAGAAQLIATVMSFGAIGSVAATDIAVINGGGTPPPPPPPADGTNGTEGNDTMIGTAANDTLNGLGGNDFMQGAGGADVLRGGTGNDTMSGNDGADSVEGGSGNDRVTGGSGQDAFVFREFGTANADTLTDFAGNTWDSLRFDNAAFTALGGDGRFVSGDARFRAGTAAADADDRIVWNSATGQVWYDADGNGAGAAQLVATLQAGATLVASDIWVV